MDNMTFLVADDSGTVRTLVKKSIEIKFSTKQVFEARDGVEAKALLESNEIDIILSGWELKNFSGGELLRWIRNNTLQRIKDIPFIMMTSHAERDFIIQALQNGITHYLVKPFSVTDMEDRIRKSWNGAVKRTASRFSALPPHHLRVKVKGKTHPARVVNISRGGALILVEHNDEFSLLGKYELSLEFEEGPKQLPWAIGSLFGSALRLEADRASMKTNSPKCQIGLIFEPNANDSGVEKKLDELVQWLSSAEPKMISDK